MFKKGDIVLPFKRVARSRRNFDLHHRAIVWQDTYAGDSDFVGLMLTSTSPSRRFDNIPLQNQHFYLDFPTQNQNSHFVNQLFHKFGSWVLLRK